MPGRRAFLAGALAAGLWPKPTWADAGSPAFISAALRSDGVYVLRGLTEYGASTFELPIPARGHAAAAHPYLAEAVAFARRPGTFAIVIDCASGRQTAMLEAPKGRHFYGHGAFSADGERLFTTEQDYESGQGLVGVWDAAAGYRRVGEFNAGGIGPHEIRLLPDGHGLAVAIGGIETHPEMGRVKLNIPKMRPNLTYMTLGGEITRQVELAPELHKNSIRHIATAVDGTVAFAMQWQGDRTDVVPLLGLSRPDGSVDLVAADRDATAAMQGYAGSVAVSEAAGEVSITSPRGGLWQVFDLRTGAYLRRVQNADVCGVAGSDLGFVLTAGTGKVVEESGQRQHWRVDHAVRWDNHLVVI